MVSLSFKGRRPWTVPFKGAIRYGTVGGSAVAAVWPQLCAGFFAAE
jgi:hypothetical protein